MSLLRVLTFYPLGRKLGFMMRNQENEMVEKPPAVSSDIQLLVAVGELLESALERGIAVQIKPQLERLLTVVEGMNYFTFTLPDGECLSFEELCEQYWDLVQKSQPK
jgi:hypothetical protein